MFDAITQLVFSQPLLTLVFISLVKFGESYLKTVGAG
jgi:hypothetical protein